MNRIVLSAAIFFLIAVPSLQAQDCWLDVKGRGAKNGSSPENAYGAQDGANKIANKCWEQTGENGTMHVLEGEYTRENKAFWQLEITADHDGPEGAGHKRLAGEGKVVLTGSRPVPYEPAKASRGEHWITIGPGVHNVKIENFSIERIAFGIQAAGNNHHLEFKNLHFTDTRQNIVLIGNPGCTRWKNCGPFQKKLSHDILLENITGLRYSKRHIRMGKGISKVQVLNSHADSGFLDGDFAVGFDVETPARDIEFVDSTARRNRYSKSEYWNGDGFKAELETENIRFIRCAAFENADGGFDIKSENAYFKDTVALKNTRNIRVWGSALLENVNASFSRKQGGIATEAGLWASGIAECRLCTIHNNKIQVHTEKNQGRAEIKMRDSIVSSELPESELLLQEAGSKISLKGSVLLANASEQNPFLQDIPENWEGNSEVFNSRYGKSKGYFYPYRI